MQAMERAWQKVRELFQAPEFFGERGAAFLEHTGAKCYLHPLAIGVPTLAGLASLTNGAAVKIWDKPSPLCIVAILVNPPQSRKSQTTQLFREMGFALDEAASTAARQELNAKIARQHAFSDRAGRESISDAVADFVPTSCVLEGFTAEAQAAKRSGALLKTKSEQNMNCCSPCEAFFEAVSGDYGRGQKKGKQGMGTGSYGRLVNVDEIYPSFLAFGLMDSDQKSKSGVNNHTSILNRLLQTGGCSKVTRTAGAYGGPQAKPISCAFVGNAHPSMCFSMLHKETCCHTAAAHDRFLFFTAPRIQPHETINDDVEVVGERSLWPELPQELARLAGLQDLVNDPERAALAGACCLGSCCWAFLLIIPSRIRQGCG